MREGDASFLVGSSTAHVAALGSIPTFGGEEKGRQKCQTSAATLTEGRVAFGTFSMNWTTSRRANDPRTCREEWGLWLHTRLALIQTSVNESRHRHCDCTNRLRITRINAFYYTRSSARHLQKTATGKPPQLLRPPHQLSLPCTSSGGRCG